MKFQSATNSNLLTKARDAAMPRGVERNASLRGRHTMGLECSAAAFAEAADLEHLRELCAWAQAEPLPILVLGSGSNTAFLRDRIHALVIKLGEGFRQVKLVSDRQVVHTGGGVTWRKLIKACQDGGFGGLEYGWCIPGTIGGALAGNAGAAGQAVCEDVVRVRVLNEYGEEQTLQSGEFAYRYRWSELKDFTILDCELRVQVAAPDQVSRRLDEMRAMRKSQPKGVASSGCAFKNPRADLTAGRLIDQCGLKGLAVGPLSVSDVHANFLVNSGGGRPAHLLELLELVEEKVFQESGIRLEREIRLIG